MAESFFKAKDWVASKVTPECLKANVEEVKAFTEKNMPKGGDPHAEGGGEKITEYEAAWNVTNAIQVTGGKSTDQPHLGTDNYVRLDNVI